MEREQNSNVRFVLNEYPDTHLSLSCYTMIIRSQMQPIHLTLRQNKQFFVKMEVRLYLEMLAKTKHDYAAV